ncbi:MAG: dTDP-4-dehydrorhamnose reductase [Blastocatellia bacterium]
MKLLITGAGGQLGRAMQAVLTGHEMVALTHAQLDITNFDAVCEAITAHRPDVVINAAAYTNVDGAESDQTGAYKHNAAGPRNLAVATHHHHIPLFHVSTDYVFDGTSNRPYHEYDAVNPQSVYGRSKLAGEQAVVAHNPRHYIVRTAWLYHTEGRNFPKTMLAQAEKAEVRVVSDQYGSPTYAPHLAAGIARLIETGAFGVVHLAGSGGTSWFELTRKLYALRGIKTEVRPVATADFPRPAARPCYSVLTTIQSPEILLPPWEEGLAAFSKAVA